MNLKSRWAISRAITINGIGIWIYMNHLGEYFLVRFRKYPKGMLSANAKDTMASTFSMIEFYSVINGGTRMQFPATPDILKPADKNVSGLEGFSLGSASVP